jgi:hypothetical protein
MPKASEREKFPATIGQIDFEIDCVFDPTQRLKLQRDAKKRYADKNSTKDKSGRLGDYSDNRNMNTDDFLMQEMGIVKNSGDKKVANSLRPQKDHYNKQLYTNGTKPNPKPQRIQQY